MIDLSDIVVCIILIKNYLLVKIYICLKLWGRHYFRYKNFQIQILF